MIAVSYPMKADTIILGGGLCGLAAVLPMGGVTNRIRPAAPAPGLVSRDELLALVG